MCASLYCAVSELFLQIITVHSEQPQPPEMKKLQCAISPLPSRMTFILSLFTTVKFVLFSFSNFMLISWLFETPVIITALDLMLFSILMIN